MKVEFPVLEFRDDGLYIDDRKIDKIKDFWLQSDAELSQFVSEVRITGIKTDVKGKPIVDEFGEFEEYYINKYVIVKGLDDQLNILSKSLLTE